MFNYIFNKADRKKKKKKDKLSFRAQANEYRRTMQLKSHEI